MSGRQSAIPDALLPNDFRCHGADPAQQGTLDLPTAGH